MDSTCLSEMPRRTFMAIIAGGLLAAPLAAEGQPAGKLPVVGVDHQNASVGPVGIPQCWRGGVPSRLHNRRTHPADLHPGRAQGDLRPAPWVVAPG
jgi:hypothetical protein